MRATNPGSSGADSAGMSPPLRYMGTKRTLAPIVGKAVLSVGVEASLTADLFSGMGSVASALASRRPVLTNDYLRFTTAFATARFKDYRRRPAKAVVASLMRPYLTATMDLEKRFARQRRAERRALEGGRGPLEAFMKEARHAGNSQHWRRQAETASGAKGVDGHCLVTLYFAAGYFSYQQAVRLDALRCAIDGARFSHPLEREWALAAWIAAAGAVINAPGHAAQFLKPTSDGAAARIARTWRRDPWEAFVDKLSALQPVGTRAWRRRNMVKNEEALELVENDGLGEVGVVYADPPYTKDHYSRYYHVYETLYLYDYPSCTGAGRYRGDRPSTGFSLVTRVEDEFRRLFGALAAREKPLVLSYPSDGLLWKAGVDVEELIREYFVLTEHTRVEAQHSTLGASSGAHQKATQESIYVCRT
jgi:adenine-specific DNA-methyltransferase